MQFVSVEVNTSPRWCKEAAVNWWAELVGQLARVKPERDVSCSDANTDGHLQSSGF